MYNMFNRQLFVVELQNQNMQLSNHSLKGNFSGSDILVIVKVCDLVFGNILHHKQES